MFLFLFHCHRLLQKMIKNKFFKFLTSQLDKKEFKNTTFDIFRTKVGLVLILVKF